MSETEAHRRVTSTRPLNFAGVFKVPLVIDNREQPVGHISSKEAQTAAELLLKRAIAAGIRCVQVDGNDAIAVYKATSEAITSEDLGPTVIECVTYRMSMHTTADDPTKVQERGRSGCPGGRRIR